MSDAVASRSFIAAPGFAQGERVSTAVEWPSPEQPCVDASTSRAGRPETTPPSAAKGALPTQRPHQDADAPVHSLSTSVGYLANRWNLGSSFSASSNKTDRHHDSLG